MLLSWSRCGLGFGFQGLWVWGSGSGLEALGFRVLRVGVRVVRVWGLGFGACRV